MQIFYAHPLNLGHIFGAYGGARGSMQQFKLQCCYMRVIMKPTTVLSFFFLTAAPNISTKYEDHAKNNVNYYSIP